MIYVILGLLYAMVAIGVIFGRYSEGATIGQSLLIGLFFPVLWGVLIGQSEIHFDE